MNSSNESPVLTNTNIIIKKKVSELTVDDIAQHCENRGITIDELCYRLSRLMKAQKIIKYEYGVDPVYDEDNNTQLKALGMALELLKLVGNKVAEVGMVVQHQMAEGDIERLEAIAVELKSLESRLIKDPIQQGRTIDIVNEATVRG